MNWRVKGIVQGALSRVPGGIQLNTFLQRAVGDLRNFEDNIEKKVDDWRVFILHLNEVGISPLTPTDTERSRDHQEIALNRTIRSYLDARVVGLGRIWIVVCPIDTVYKPGLRVGRTGRHGEIRIASKHSQKCDFIVEPTPSTIRSRVVQRPVPA